MKKIITVLLIIALPVFMFSCSKGEAGPAGITGADAAGNYVINFQDGVYPAPAYVLTSDARIDGGSPDAVSGDFFSVGIYNASSYWRTLLRFEIEGSLPEGARVISAYVTVTMNSGDGTADVTAYRVTQPWVESEVTWNSYSTGNSWGSAGGDYGSAVSGMVSMDKPGKYMFSISPSLVESWEDDGTNNYGIIFIAANETTPVNRYHGRTREYSTATDRPKLTIIYDIP